jgi:hypothetical protein
VEQTKGVHPDSYLSVFDKLEQQRKVKANMHKLPIDTVIQLIEGDLSYEKCGPML